LAAPDATAFEAISGEGIIATLEGHRVAAGNARLLRREGIDTPQLLARVADLAERGRTPVLVAIDGRPAGVIGVADRVRPSARRAIARLSEQGITPVMLTGDIRPTAEAVAREVGIERVIAEVLPADKAGEVRRLQAEGARVAMVGDGVNDAPALATADVGIAIGAGADVAIETASVVLMKSDPYDVPRAIELSRATVRKMQQNLFWASIYNILAIPVAAGVLYPSWGILLRPEWSALLMSASSIIVATNAVMLKRVEGKLDGGAGAPAGGEPIAAQATARPA
jgi:Cu2+-exporting ATPase